MPAEPVESPTDCAILFLSSSHPSMPRSRSLRWTTRHVVRWGTPLPSQSAARTEMSVIMTQNTGRIEALVDRDHAASKRGIELENLLRRSYHGRIRTSRVPRWIVEIAVG